MGDGPSKGPGVIGGILRWLGWAKSSALSGPTARRTSFEDELGLPPLSCAFDSPLQEAIRLLGELQDRLQDIRVAHRSADLQTEVDCIDHITRLLHAPDLTGTKSIKQMVEESSMNVDPQLSKWLEAMEWLPKREGDDHQEEEDGSAPEKQLSTVHEGLSERATDRNTERDSKASFSSSVINPKLAASVQADAESSILHMLEYDLTEWEFDTLTLHELTGGHALQALGWALAKRHGFTTTLGCHTETLLQFLGRVEEGYRTVPYHNSAHAACVTHGVHCLLSTMPELRPLCANPLDMFTCIFAALTHDLGHTGHNNAFHVASNSELAVLYSDQSVLEMHHLACAFKILSDKESNIMAKLLPDVRRDVRSRVIQMVLATDLSFNFQVMNTFKQMVTEKQQAATDLQAAREGSQQHVGRRRHSSVGVHRVAASMSGDATADNNRRHSSASVRAANVSAEALRKSQAAPAAASPPGSPRASPGSPQASPSRVPSALPGTIPEGISEGIASPTPSTPAASPTPSPAPTPSSSPAPSPALNRTPSHSLMPPRSQKSLSLSAHNHDHPQPYRASSPASPRTLAWSEGHGGSASACGAHSHTQKPVTGPV